MHLGIFLGTRPEIIKMASVIKALNKRTNIEVSIIATGQHYDPEMFDCFIETFELPKPELSFEVEGRTHGKQTAEIIVKTEEFLMREKLDAVIVLGDTNSALGVTLAAVKLRIPVVHVEAGCRSFDVTMPEEINRVIIDHCALLNCAPTENTLMNLVREKIDESKCVLTGHPLVDTLNIALENVSSSKILNIFGVESKNYGVLTLHRESNVDDLNRLHTILDGVVSGARNMPFLFPMHPRTQKNAVGLEALFSNIIVTEPMQYIDFLKLLLESRIVVTDSGGVQQEAALLKVPCVTARETTEWPETVKLGVNILAGVQTKSIEKAITEAINKTIEIANKDTSRMFGSLGAGERIADCIEKFMHV